MLYDGLSSSSLLSFLLSFVLLAVIFHFSFSVFPSPHTFQVKFVTEALVPQERRSMSCSIVWLFSSLTLKSRKQAGVSCSNIVKTRRTHPQARYSIPIITFSVKHHIMKPVFSIVIYWLIKLSSAVFRPCIWTSPPSIPASNITRLIQPQITSQPKRRIAQKITMQANPEPDILPGVDPVRKQAINKIQSALKVSPGRRLLVDRKGSLLDLYCENR